jgi:hypothetical protein
LTLASYLQRLIFPGLDVEDELYIDQSQVRERFPFTPLFKPVYMTYVVTSEIQWQSRGQRLILQGGVQTGKQRDNLDNPVSLTSSFREFPQTTLAEEPEPEQAASTPGALAPTTSGKRHVHNWGVALVVGALSLSMAQLLNTFLRDCAFEFGVH